jgi:hypothetical protein
LPLDALPSDHQPSQKLQLHHVANQVAQISVGNRQNNVFNDLNSLATRFLPSHTIALQLPTKDAQVLQARTNLSTFSSSSVPGWSTAAVNVSFCCNGRRTLI